jgi:hypothetical protein
MSGRERVGTEISIWARTPMLLARNDPEVKTFYVRLSALARYTDHAGIVNFWGLLR